MKNAPVLFALLILSACAGEQAHPPVDPNSYANWSASAEYIGKEACAECHADQAALFAGAQMGQSFRPARASLSNAEWDGVRPVRDPDRDFYYQPLRRGEDLFVREYRITNGDTTHVREVQIDYIVGSGQHTNSHIRDENGYLYQIPITWYAQEGQWSMAPGFDGGNNIRFDRPITEQCMACHDGPSDYWESSENRYSDVPHGIECENCHGPGSLHVEAIRAGRVVDVTTDIDRNIVNPAKLTPERLDDVCQRCHMQGAAVLKPETTALDYRPGRALTDYMDVFWPRFADSTSQFLMASHPDRLQMSACWQASRAEGSDLSPITCLTCHNPHEPVEARTRDVYNSACLDCHESQKVDVCTEALDVRLEVGNDCSSCHMPQSSTMDIDKVQITDHFIRVTQDPVSTRDESVQGDLVRMASLLRDDVDLVTLAAGYLTYFEEVTNRPLFLDSARAVLQRVPPGEGLRERVRLAYLGQEWDALAALAARMVPSSQTDAWTAYRIGEGFFTQGSTQNAVVWLQRAVDLAPDHVRFLDKLGTAYTAAGQSAEAEAVLNDVVARDPTFAHGWNNRGFLKLTQGDLVGGEADFLQALRLDPDLPEALGNMASLLLNTGRIQESVPYATRLLFLDPDNPDYRQFYLAVSGAAGD